LNHSLLIVCVLLLVAGTGLVIAGVDFLFGHGWSMLAGGLFCFIAVAILRLGLRAPTNG